MEPGGDTTKHVAMGEVAVGRASQRLVARGVGSCVVVALHDPWAQVVGLAHAMLPWRGMAGDRPTKYVDSALERLLVEMEAAGARRARTTARLIGGAAMFRAEPPAAASAIGERNVEAARAELARHGIPVVAAEVGGYVGRSVEIEAASGELKIRKLE